MAISANGEYLVGGANDFVVKCVRLTADNGEHQPTDHYRFECDAQIVDLAIDPKSVFYALATADGVVQIRTLAKASENSRKPLAQFPLCVKFKQIGAETPRLKVSVRIVFEGWIHFSNV